MENYQKQILKWFSSPTAGKSYIFDYWDKEQETQKELREKSKKKVKGIKPNFIFVDEIL